MAGIAGLPNGVVAPKDLLESFETTPTSGRALFVQDVADDVSRSVAEKVSLFERTLTDDSPQMPTAREELLEEIAAKDPDYAIAAFGEILRTAPAGDILGSGGRGSLARALAPSRDKLVAACEAWLAGAPTPLLVLQVSDVLLNVSEGDDEELIETTRTWAQKAPEYKFIQLEILHEFLSRHLKSTTHPTAVIAHAHVLALAKAAGLEPRDVAQETSDPYRQAIVMAKRLKRPPAQVNWTQLDSNLKQVPSLVRFLGNRFQEIVANRKEHPLVWMLHWKPPPMSRLATAKAKFEAGGTPLEKASAALVFLNGRADQNWLGYLEDVFSRIAPGMHGSAKMRDNLLNPTQTADTLCEAEILSRAARTKVVEAETRSAGFTSPRDVRIQGKHGGVVLEVYNPKPDWEMQFGRGLTQLDPDLLMDRVMAKFRKQLKSQTPTEPLVLVIHAGQGPFDDWDAERILRGSQVTVIEFEKKSGTVARVQDKHQTDAISDEEPASDILSGILLYRRGLEQTPPVLRCEYTANPRARRPLSAQLEGELLESVR